MGLGTRLKRMHLNSKFDIRKIQWSLYAILDKGFVKDRSIATLAEDLIKGGAGVIQLRNKSSETHEFYLDAVEVKAVTQKHGIPLIINDRLDIARAVEAAGVHLGQKDLPLQVARSLIGKEMILGASVHNLTEFNQAVEAGADYLGVGTMYPTNTKKVPQIMGVQFVRRLRSKTDLPMVAIGGITLENLTPVIQAGADGVAVISALLSVEDVATRARQFVQKIRSAKISSNLGENYLTGSAGRPRPT
jgi:thiamine-phosphate pyrophosphorylase